MGLDVPLVHGGGGELPLDDHVGPGEALFDISRLLLVVAIDIALFAGVLAKLAGGAVLVEERGALLHGLAHVDYGGQRLVHDLDQIDRLLGDVRAGGSDRGHGVAFVEHLAGGQGILGDFADVDAGLADVGYLVDRFDQVGGGDHTPHTGQFESPASVDGKDAGVGVGRSQDLAVEQAGEPHIGAV